MPPSSRNRQHEDSFDLKQYAKTASLKRTIPNYERLQSEHAPDFKKFLSTLRDRLKEHRKDEKKVLVILGTGGTFQSESTTEGYAPTENLRESFNALQMPKDESIHLELCDLMNADSSQMTVQQWRFIAEMIVLLEEEAGDLYDGIIITHGTDTMSKGASYLSFMLQGFPKSIVFTGSQYPALEKGSDAKDQMERAIVTSKIAASAGRRICEVMVACGLKVSRATWAAKQGDKTTNAFAPWNQTSQEYDATDWAQAARDGTLHRLAPALIDFGTGKNSGSLEIASHAMTLENKKPYDPFTNITHAADLYPVQLSDKSTESFAQHLIQQKVSLLTQLGSATADDTLVDLAMTAANHGKIVLFEAPFPDSTVQTGTYKAGAAVRENVPLIHRTLPILNTSPSAFEAKVNYVLHKLNIQPLAYKKGLGIVYNSVDLRRFYDAMESNMVGELV